MGSIAMKSKIALAPLLTCLGVMLVVNEAEAADIVVSSLVPLKFVMSALIPMYEASSGNKIVITYDNAAVATAKVKSAAAPDLIIMSPETIDGLVKEDLIAGGRTDVFISGIGLAVKAGAPKPDIGSVEAFKKTLLGAKSVAQSKFQSGVYFASVLNRLGIADQMKPKIVVVESGPVGVAAANGDAEIAVQQLTELLAVPGIDLVGPLPADLQTKIVYAAGIPVSAKHSDAAKALLNFFASPAAVLVIKAKGLEPG
jgi:molybdate transport system substrate-binding protein